MEVKGKIQKMYTSLYKLMAEVPSNSHIRHIEIGTKTYSFKVDSYSMAEKMAQEHLAFLKEHYKGRSPKIEVTLDRIVSC